MTYGRSLVRFKIQHKFTSLLNMRMRINIPFCFHTGCRTIFIPALLYLATLYHSHSWHILMLKAPFGIAGRCPKPSMTRKRALWSSWRNKQSFPLAYQPYMMDHTLSPMDAQGQGYFPWVYYRDVMFWLFSLSVVQHPFTLYSNNFI